MSRITCNEFEILLADYFDGTLAADQKAAVDEHRNACASCAELALDASGAMAFIERAASVEPPPALVNRILLEVTRRREPQRRQALLDRAAAGPARQIYSAAEVRDGDGDGSHFAGDGGALLGCG